MQSNGFSRFFYFLAAGMLLLSACKARKVDIGPNDESQAAGLMKVGVRYLDKQNYEAALRIFQDVAERSFTTQTTRAILLSGITQYHLKDKTAALQNFNQLIDRFPKSKYVGEARYHKALLLISNATKENQFIGMDLLGMLMETSTDLDLAQSAKQALQNFAFNTAEEDNLLQYYVRAIGPTKLEILNALCYRRIKEGRTREAQQLYFDHKRLNGEDTPFLSDLFSVKPTGSVSKKFQMAVILPFFLDNNEIRYSNTVPENIKIWLEFYEGFQFAIQEYKAVAGKELVVKVYDSKDNPLEAQKILQELGSEKIDLLIGGHDFAVSSIISEWAETAKVPYFNPLNSNDELLLNKTHTYITTASSSVHGIRMAEYAYDSLGLRNIAIWGNGLPETRQMATAFKSTFESRLLAKSYLYEIDTFFNAQTTPKQINKFATDMNKRKIDGVYIPINRDEESANLVLSTMKQMGIQAIVMGSPRWRNYNLISQQVKESFNLHFTTSSLPNEQIDAYTNLYNAYLREYYYPPSIRTMQGYDFGKYMLEVIDDYDFLGNLGDFIEVYPSFQGIQAGFYFNKQKVNQKVNIAKFANGTVIAAGKN